VIDMIDPKHTKVIWIIDHFLLLYIVVALTVLIFLVIGLYP